MKMIKNLVIGLVALVISFAAGRYTASVPEVTQTTSKDKVVDTDTHTEVTTTKDKDGTIKVVKVTDTKSKSETKAQSKTITADAPKVRVQALYGYHFTDRKQIYGVSVSKQVLGPISLGVWAMTNGVNEGMAGISAGWDF